MNITSGEVDKGQKVNESSDTNPKLPKPSTKYFTGFYHISEKNARKIVGNTKM